MFNNINEALEEFKMGNPILVVDDESRENEGDIIFPADAVYPRKNQSMCKRGQGASLYCD